MKILVTGANGFVGHAMVQNLRLNGHEVVRVVRTNEPDAVIIRSLDAQTDWNTALRGCDAVIHLAAKVHQMHNKRNNLLPEFRRVNVEGTLHLARQANLSGVRRFIFASSIKVNGEEHYQPYKETDTPVPCDAYGMSKWEAEKGLNDIAACSNMKVVIIRPPLIYGPGVKANFLAMMSWLDRGLPLPLGAITHNRRSLLALDNLVDLIQTCLRHPAAANQTFLVSDGEDLSTADLLVRMGQALNKPARLFFVPAGMLKLGAGLLNKQGVYQRLCGSLQVDISKARQLLDWAPPLTVDEGLRRAAQGLRR